MAAQVPVRPRTRVVRALAAACHPLPSAAVTVVAVLLGAGVGLDAGRTALLGVAVLTGQLSIGWSNDRIDAARDALSRRTDKPAGDGRLPLPVLSAAAGAALVLAVASSLLLGWAPGLAALVLVAAGWAYNLGLKSTPASALAYLIGFGALPAAAYLALPGHVRPPWWAVLTGGLLGVAAHFADVLPDLHTDDLTGVRGLPQRLGLRRGVPVMGGCLLAAAVVLAYGAAPDAATRAVAVGVGAVLGLAATVLGARRPDDPTTFRLIVVIALLDVVLVLALIR